MKFQQITEKRIGLQFYTNSSHTSIAYWVPSTVCSEPLTEEPLPQWKCNWVVLYWVTRPPPDTLILRSSSVIFTEEPKNSQISQAILTWPLTPLFTLLSPVLIPQIFHILEDILLYSNFPYSDVCCEQGNSWPYEATEKKQKKSLSGTCSLVRWYNHEQVWNGHSRSLERTGPSFTNITFLDMSISEIRFFKTKMLYTRKNTHASL